MASPAPTDREVDSLMRLFEHDLAICTDDEKKNNINACVAYLKKNGVKGLPRGDHVIFAHKGTVELISWAKFENYFTNPTTKTDYIRDKDKHYLVTQSLPPVPADQKLQVAEYILKEKGLAGMHLIFAKVRLPPKYGGTGQDEDAASLDVCYDTGSTIQVLHINNHWKHIGGSKYTATKKRTQVQGAGGIEFTREVVRVELRVFKDIEHQVPLTGWFEAEAVLGKDNETLLSGFEMVAKQGLMFACVSANTKLLVAHENNKLALAWKVWTS